MFDSSMAGLEAGAFRDDRRPWPSSANAATTIATVTAAATSTGRLRQIVAPQRRRGAGLGHRRRGRSGTAPRPTAGPRGRQGTSSSTILLGSLEPYAQGAQAAANSLACHHLRALQLRNDLGVRAFLEHPGADGVPQTHLRKVFGKLGISSRNQLERALPTTPAPVGWLGLFGRSLALGLCVLWLLVLRLRKS